MNQFLEYLTNKRKLSEVTIQTFELGWYAGNSNEAYFESDNQDLIGMVEQLDWRFEDCILFPVYNLYGGIMAISARPLIKKEKDPRFINTVYIKGDTLYGLHKTWKHILKEGKAFVVEGNFDMLTLYDKGIRNVVALLGSNFSFTQLCLLLRFTDSIIIAADADEAGDKLTKRIRETLDSRRISYEVMQLPEGSDPDSYVNENGKNEFLNLIKKRNECTLTTYPESSSIR